MIKRASLVFALHGLLAATVAAIPACSSDVEVDPTATPDASDDGDGITPGSDTGTLPATDGSTTTDGQASDAGDAADAGPDAPPPITCSDGKKNGDETDEDCGGSCTTKCAEGKGCNAVADCATGGKCTGNICQPPTSTDELKNGDETDVDCGGGTAPACAPDKTCLLPDDCASGYCGAAGTPLAGKCLYARSCTGGKGATNDCGAADDESCCTTLPVPGGTFKRPGNSNATVSDFKLDKYEVTAGRMRAFFAAYDGNLRGTAPIAAGQGAHPAIADSGWKSTWNVRLPGSWDEINDIMTVACYRGGDNANGGGATTWTPSFGNPAGFYDDLPANCLPWYWAAAFCAWDGGRLPTDAEWWYAYKGGSEQRPYPWGAAPAYADVTYLNDPNVVGNMVGLYTTHAFCTDPGGGPACFSVGTLDRANNGNDGPAHLSSPGKKPLGNARWGHADMAGNVIEFLLDSGSGRLSPCVNCANVTSSDPVNLSPYPVVDGVEQWTETPGRAYGGGSWERHGITGTDFNRPHSRNYYAMGFRCARD